MNFEFAVLDGIQTYLTNGVMDWLMIFISSIGNSGIVWIVLTIALILYPKTRMIGLMFGVALLLGFVSTNLVIKNLIARPRPFTYNDFDLLIKRPSEFSFPSGHATAAFATTFVMVKERLKIGEYRVYIPLFVLAIVMAFSRLYLYVHFLSDIMGGLIVGYLCATLAIYSVGKAAKKIKE